MYLVFMAEPFLSRQGIEIGSSEEGDVPVS